MSDYLEPMELTKVETEHSTHYEPELNPQWKPSEKLRWKMGVVLANSGLKTRLYVEDEWRFCLNIVRKGSVSALSYRPYSVVWDNLTYLDLGAEIAQEFLDNRAGSS